MHGYNLDLDFFDDINGFEQIMTLEIENRIGEGDLCYQRTFSFLVLYFLFKGKRYYVIYQKNINELFGKNVFLMLFLIAFGSILKIHS